MYLNMNVFELNEDKTFNQLYVTKHLNKDINEDNQMDNLEPGYENHVLFAIDNRKDNFAEEFEMFIQDSKGTFFLLFFLPKK